MAWRDRVNLAVRIRREQFAGYDRNHFESRQGTSLARQINNDRSSIFVAPFVVALVVGWHARVQKGGSGMSQEHQPCIEACIACAQECEHCADACLGEKNVAKMTECIRLDRDCAALCWQTSAFMSRGSHFAQELCRVCAEVCEACGLECRKHQVDHCQRCADACERCAEECRKMAGVSA